MNLTGASLLAHVRYAVAGCGRTTCPPKSAGRSSAAVGVPERRAAGAARTRYRSYTHRVAASATDKLLPRLTANEDLLRSTFAQLTEAVTGRSPDDAGRRMAARQLLSDRGTDPHGQEAPAQGLQPRAARLLNGRRPGFRASMTSRSRRSRMATDGSIWRASAFRRRLPEGHDPEARRILGDPDHAAPRADRESPPRRRCGSRPTGSTAICADVLGASDDRRSSEKDPKSLILVIADMARSNPPMTAPFVSEFVRPCRDRAPHWHCALSWIEQRLRRIRPDDRAADAGGNHTRRPTR